MRDGREVQVGGPIWWIFIIRGGLAAALGIFALLWPTQTLSVLILLVGTYLIADGVMGLVLASHRAAVPGRFFQPAASALIGLLLVLWPSESARTLFVVLGCAALFMGISYLVTARRFGLDDMDRRLMTGTGAAACAVGVVLIVWPGAGVVTFTWLIAIAALVAAAVLLFLGVRFKQMQVRVEIDPPRDPGGGAGPHG